LRISPVADADLALHDRDPIRLFAAMFVGQFETAEPFTRKIERGMDPPEPLFFLASGPAFRTVVASMRRSGRPWGRHRQSLADQ
jgi:hypothetical protein